MTRRAVVYLDFETNHSPITSGTFPELAVGNLDCGHRQMLGLVDRDGSHHNPAVVICATCLSSARSCAPKACACSWPDSCAVCNPDHAGLVARG